jgi:hypothetical protein
MQTLVRIVMVAALPGVLFGCSTQSTPTAPNAPAAPTVRFSDLKTMAGTYMLTIDLDETCSSLPAVAQQRRYRAVLEDRGWHFLVVSVIGGGFPEPVQLGDLFSGELSPLRPTEPELQWNSFDLGCDVGEPLGDIGAFTVCGRGPVTKTASGLAAKLSGHAAILRTGSTGPRCMGIHRFVFTRDQ